MTLWCWRPAHGPRPLPIAGADLAGVHLLRTAADVDAIRPDFVAGAKLVVIGAGYIGLEVAAVARGRGLDVTVVEAAPRPLARVTSPEVAGFFLDEHTRQGVRFVLGGQVARHQWARTRQRRRPGRRRRYCRPIW